MGQVSVLNRCSGELAPFLPYFLPPSPAPSSVSRYLDSPEALPCHQDSLQRSHWPGLKHLRRRKLPQGTSPGLLLSLVLPEASNHKTVSP